MMTLIYSDKKNQIASPEAAPFDILAAILRQDLVAFIQKVFATVSPEDEYKANWHIEAIAYELTQCLEGNSSRLLITQPPRSLKSICTSVALVAWALGHNPKKRFICVSYSDDLSKDLSRQFRMVVESDWYRAIFPNVQLIKNTDNLITTSKGGSRLATSIGATLTGRGADVIIIDDPLKAEEAERETARSKANDWYSSTLVSRLNDKEKGAIILVMQRLHEDDLAGYVLQNEKTNSKAKQWRHLDLPAIAEEDQTVQLGENRLYDRKAGELLHAERETQTSLDALKQEIGTTRFEAQYQQRPVPASGNIIQREWIQSYDELPAEGRIIQSWDIAITENLSSDYSVCTTWLTVKNDYYLIDVWRQKRNFPDVKKTVTQLAEKQNAKTVLIESAGPGQSLVQQLKQEHQPPRTSVIGIKPNGDKVSRLHAQSAKFEAGQVFLPKEASWLTDYLHELLGFPNTKHDDQVDSTSQFLHWISKRRTDVAVGYGSACIGYDSNGNGYIMAGKPSHEYFRGG